MGIGHLRPSNRQSGLIAAGGTARPAVVRENTYAPGRNSRPMAELRTHVSEFVEAAEGSVDGVTAADLATALESGRVTVVDVGRENERRDHGAIPGSVWVPRGDVEYAADPESEYHDPAFDVEGRYVCYCTGGGRGALAAATLAEMGYADVAYLEDGFVGWAEVGLPVEPVEMAPDD